MASRRQRDAGGFEDRPWLLPVPGRPDAARFGPGSASGYQYSTPLGEMIADLYVDEPGGLWGIHAAMPERIPPPAIVRAWCKQFPAFGLLMREAEKLRAEKLMEETVVLADTSTASPARLALMISTRHAYAGKLDAARYGKGDTPHDGPAQLGAAQVQPTAPQLTDDQLASIAASAVESGGERGAGG